MVESLLDTDLSRYKPDWERLGVVVPPFTIEADPRFMYLSVSYTHLDVYKRQHCKRRQGAWQWVKVRTQT